jgi:drug/metabolite transporter (DMT)-like permease
MHLHGRSLTPSLGLVALVLGATSISLAVIASKQAFTDGADARTILAARLVLAALLVAPVVFASMRGGGSRLGIAGIVVGIGAGATLWVGGRTELEGLARLPAGTLVLLLATVPVWVATLGLLGIGRPPTPIERGALVGVVAGVAIMAVPIGAAIDPAGVAFGLMTALSFTVFLLILDRNRTVPQADGFLLGLMGAAFFFAVTDPGTVRDLTTGPLELPLILALGATTAIWAVLVGIGLQATDAVTAAIVVDLEPVLVAVLAFLLLDEGLSAREIVGGLVVLAALAALAIQARSDARASASERTASIGRT